MADFFIYTSPICIPIHVRKTGFTFQTYCTFVVMATPRAFSMGVKYVPLMTAKVALPLILGMRLPCTRRAIDVRIRIEHKCSKGIKFQ
jgi:hypothetical protein